MHARKDGFRKVVRHEGGRVVTRNVHQPIGHRMISAVDERSLGTRDGHGRVGRNFRGQREGIVHESIALANLGDKANLEGLLGREKISRQTEFSYLGIVPGNLWKALQGTHVGGQSDFDLSDRKYSSVGAKPNVADRGQIHASPYAAPLYGSNHWNWTFLDGRKALLHLDNLRIKPETPPRHVQGFFFGVGVRKAKPLIGHVDPRGKGLGSRASQNNGSTIVPDSAQGGKDSSNLLPHDGRNSVSFPNSVQNHHHNIRVGSGSPQLKARKVLRKRVGPQLPLRKFRHTVWSSPVLCLWTMD